MQRFHTYSCHQPLRSFCFFPNKDMSWMGKARMNAWAFRWVHLFPLLIYNRKPKQQHDFPYKWTHKQCNVLLSLLNEAINDKRARTVTKSCSLEEALKSPLQDMTRFMIVIHSDWNVPLQAFRLTLCGIWGMKAAHLGGRVWLWAEADDFHPQLSPNCLLSHKHSLTGEHKHARQRAASAPQ